MTKRLGQITAVILLAGSVMIVHAGDKKKNQDSSLKKYQVIENKIKAGVDAGKLSSAEAKKKLAGIKNAIRGGDKARLKGEEKKAGRTKKKNKGSRKEIQGGNKAKFIEIEKELRNAVKQGKLSKADAMKKLVALKKKMSGAHDKGDGTEKKKVPDGREAKFRVMEEKILAAVKSGKISKTEAEKKLVAMKKAIWPDKQGQGKKDPPGNKKDPRKARYHEAEKEIIAAVKAGKISREEAGKKLAGLRKQLGTDSKAGSRAGGSDKGKSQDAEGKAKKDDTPRAKYQAVAKRIAIAVKEGKISKVDGEKRLLAYRKQLGAGAGAGKGAGAGAGKGAGAGAGNTTPRKKIPGRPR